MDADGCGRAGEGSGGRAAAAMGVRRPSRRATARAADPRRPASSRSTQTSPTQSPCRKAGLYPLQPRRPWRADHNSRRVAAAHSVGRRRCVSHHGLLRQPPGMGIGWGAVRGRGVAVRCAARASGPTRRAPTPAKPVPFPRARGRRTRCASTTRSTPLRRCLRLRTPKRRVERETGAGRRKQGPPPATRAPRCRPPPLAPAQVDMVLLGGDLFHDNKPSRTAVVSQWGVQVCSLGRVGLRTRCRSSGAPCLVGRGTAAPSMGRSMQCCTRSVPVR